MVKYIFSNYPIRTINIQIWKIKDFQNIPPFLYGENKDQRGSIQ